MAIVKDELEEERADWDENHKGFATPYFKALDLVKGQVVADICCGLGLGSRILARKARYVRGYDYSKTAIEHCRQERLKNVEYILADVEETGIVGDVITCMQGLEHLHNPRKLIDKYKDRTWIFALPHEETLQIQHHKTLITDEIIEKWFGNIPIYHFRDDGTIWLAIADPTATFTNFYGVYNERRS